MTRKMYETPLKAMAFLGPGALEKLADLVKVNQISSSLHTKLEGWLFTPLSEPGNTPTDLVGGFNPFEKY